MSRVYTLLIIGFSLVILISCGKEPGENIEIEAAFSPYVNKFVEEAEARGIAVDFSDTGLSVKFGDVPESAAATCSELGSSIDGSHRITVLRSYWAELEDGARERLIFHELGHCELNRPHDNQIFSNGDWKSIMRGEPLPNKTALVNYTGRRRQYYVDELFSPSINSPDWINITTTYRDVSLNQKTLVFERSSASEFLDTLDFSNDNNFEIEFSLEQTVGDGLVGFFWGGRDLARSYFVYFSDQNKLIIGSGPQVLGPMYVVDLNDGFSTKSNKIVIRRTDDLYYYFINEEFVYWTDSTPNVFHQIGSLVDENNQAKFTNIRFYRID